MQKTTVPQISNKTKGLTRRASGLMALEPRFMFDGAAVADALNTLAPTDTAHDIGWLQFANGADQTSAALSTAQQEAQRIVADYLQRPDATQQLFALFNGGQTTPSAQWQQAANDLLAQVRDNTLSVRVEMRSSAELQGALGAFAANGTDGQPVIYLNADYVQTASSAAIEAVLVEEIGHALDNLLNPHDDSPGDEGHAFAALLLNKDAGVAAVPSDNDHTVLNLDGQMVAVEQSGPYNIAQVHFVPLPEGNLQTAQRAISSNVSGNENTVIAITATSSSTVIVYDQWEDGYEADINNPIQSTTQIWGDGDLNNGVAPGTTNDLIQAGQTIVLQNQVNPASPSTLDFDGRDKIGSTQAVSVVRAGWSITPGTVLAGAVSVIDTGNAGTDYVVPIGQDVETVATGTNKLFEYTSLHIIATQDGTTVNIDTNGDGTFDLTNIALNQGETYFVNGGVMAGAHITANKGIGVYSVAGDVGSAYENRWFALTPTEQWSSSYYAPVSTTLTADPSYVLLYNPNATAIDVYYDTATTSGTKVTVVANTGSTTGTNYVLMPASAAHFYTRDGSKFFAVGVIDADATSNATHDWSYSLVPESYLTTKFVVGWAPGYDGAPTGASLNGSPVWVTATDDTTIYIDNGASMQVKDAAGATVTGTAVVGSSTGAYAFDVVALQSYRVFDTADKNQSGLTVYTDDGTLITAAWGEDPSIAGAGTPYLDMGTTVLPFPDYVFGKTSVEASPVTYTGASDGDSTVELGEQIEYTLTLTNRAVIDLFNINIKDAISQASANAASYVAGSTTIKIIRADGTVALDTTAIADDASGSPLDLTGYTLTDADPTVAGTQGLKRGDQVIVKYRVQVSSDIAALAGAGFVVTNDAQMDGNPAGSNTGVTRSTSNQTIVSINGTYDGQVFIKDSAFAGSASTFQEGATVGLEVQDNDANRNTTAADTLSVTVTNTVTGETEQVTLTETGVNTNVFRATLATSASNGAGNNNGTLQFRAGDTIRADYTDPVYGVVFDNPTNPGVSGDGDGNIATGNANTASASIAVPSQTKVLYFSDDSTNNLDRNQPLNADNTAASTGTLVTSSGTSVEITDSFSTQSYASGTGWSGSWTEINDDGVIGSSNVRVSDADSTSATNYAVYLRAGDVGVSRNFAALASNATLTFDIKDSSSSRAYEDGDFVSVQQYISGAWAEVAKIYGTSISTNYASQTLTLTAGATGLRFITAAANDSNDRVYIDNVKIATGIISTANISGTTDFALSSTASAGQSFSLANTAATTDAVAIDQITLSLKKTGTTPATATVSIRNAWDGAVLWSTTLSTSQLSTSYKDIALATTGLTLDKTGSYVIRVDSNASGIVWQGDTSSVYADGNRISSNGTAVTTSDLRFAVKGHETGLTAVTFSQGLTMATDFTIPAGGVVKVVTYVTNETDLTGDAIKAQLFDNGVEFANSSSPVYDSVNHTLTWSFSALGTAKTIVAGHAVTLKITNNSTTPADQFKIAYDSYSTPSRIELPTTTVITLADADAVTAGVQEVAFFDNSFVNGGNPITAGTANAGAIVYVRFKVADPFGDYDISSLDLTINGPGTSADISINLADAYVVDAANDGRAYKTYEYAWQTAYNVGSYAVGVVAHEGTEGTVTDTATTSLLVTETDLGTPSITMFRTQLAANSGVEAGAVYNSGARTYLRVTDLDETGHGSVTAVVSVGGYSYTVTLTELIDPVTTLPTGIFEADLGSAASHVSNTASQTDVQAAGYFASLPNGASLTVDYTDPNDSTDTSSDAIVVNTPPQAVDNNRTVGLDKQVTGNVITDDDNGNTAGGVDADTNNSQTLRVTAVNGNSSSVSDTITLPSGARLLVNIDGSYIYDPSSLTHPPTSGSSVSDSFTYTISDGQGGTSTATVNITVDYVNPIVIDDQASTDGAVIEFDVSNKFADLAASYDLQFGIGNTNVLPAGLVIDPYTGLITGTISAGVSGNTGSSTYTVDVTVRKFDPDTGSEVTPAETRSFFWTVTNIAPLAVNDTKSTSVNVAVSANMVTNDSDGAPDSDNLTVNRINGSTYLLNANIATSHGTVRVTNPNGAYTYIPNAGYTGADSFTYTISDGNGGSSTATVYLSVIGVNEISVNEGSPYAVFEVSGVANEQVTLSLANGTATMDSNGIPLQDGSEDFGPVLEYSTDGGANWSTYSSTAVALNGSGRLLVRTAVIHDALYEGAHTFRLRATNIDSTFADGTATIRDDGTGQWFDGTGGTGSSTAPNGQVLDDDRPLTVNDIRVNEGSPFAVFTVTGKEGQQVKLNLSNGTATIENGNGTVLTDGSEDFGPALQYWNGSAWTNYTANSFITIPSDGDGTAGETAKLLVRTAVNPDALDEGDHTFTLTATNTGGSTGTGTATIDDHGGGVKYPDVAPTGPTSTDPTPGTDTTSLDDDRPLTVNDIRVNEGSPFAVFTVTGKEGQQVKLNLGNGTATIENGNGTVLTDGSEDFGPALQYWNGSAWTHYTANSFITIPSDGDGTAGETAKLLVRTAVNPDALDEGDHTFTLTATNTGGSTGTGTATIDDHGGGVKYPDVAPTGPTSTDPTPGTDTTSLDDDRPITVTGGSYNENSPRAVFTVNANPGQVLTLDVQNAAPSGKAPTGDNEGKPNDSLDTADIYYSLDGGATWQLYTGPVTAGSVPVLVAVDITNERDDVYEGEEQLKLVVTSGNQSASDYAAIFDDGTGDITAPIDQNTRNNTGANDPAVVKDDDRPISVTGYGPVNEGSQYAMFTVTATPGYSLDLDLQAATSGAEATRTGFTYEYSTNGTTWTTYDATHKPTVPAGGKVYVRVDIRSEADAPYEGAETFALKASYTANPAKSAAADTSIVDDGTGTKYGPNVDPANGPATNTSDLDDDRSISVTGYGPVNEGSQYAMFTVTATPGNSLDLDLQAATSGAAATRTGFTYEYSTNGTTWTTYDATHKPTVPVGGKVYVRVDIRSEADAPYEGAETFALKASYTANPAKSAAADTSIVDDGTGTKYGPDVDPTNGPATNTNDLDDDRPKAALPPTPPAPAAPPAPPAEPTPLPPVATPPQAFSSTLAPLAPRLVPVEPPMSLGEVLTSNSGYPIPVSETAPVGLTINRGVTDQFIQSTDAASKISLPFDAFIHSNKDAVIKLEAKNADNSPLPQWVQFDPATGVFEVTPPKGFKGKLDLKVIARDDDGREAVAMFQMFVGEQTTNRVQSRDSFSEKLRLAGKRPITLMRVADSAKVQGREGVAVRVRAG